MSFRERAASMGFTRITDFSYFYEDRFSNVVYKEIQPKDLEGEVPGLAIYTSRGDTQYQFAGLVSDLYTFVGNETVVGAIENSVNEVGTPILNQLAAMNAPKCTQLCLDMVIRNGNSIPEIGDVYPTVNIWNSYDGTKSAGISFGLMLYEAANQNFMHSMSFRNTLGSFKQIHVANSSTTLSYAIGSYIQNIHENIGQLISENMNNPIDEVSLLTSLDLVEKVGKKKRPEITSYLESLTNQQRPVTSWDLFLAITKFSTVERNLNSRLLLENIVEKIMVIPAQMLQALPRLNQQAA